MPVGGSVRDATARDVPAMVALSSAKRTAYAAAQPQFWKRAPDADEKQTGWFAHLVAKPGVLALVAEDGASVVGFVVAADTPIPPVYRPDGKVVTIDDFCVASPALWETTGRALLDEARRWARDAGAAQVVVVCGAHDAEKRALLRSTGLPVASEWYVGQP